MPEPYRFGKVEIRPAQRQVLIGGQPAALRSRTFDVLLALVERHDRLVSKHELLDLAWPGVVVEENNLQVQVSALRRLLGAKAIATIPGRGYRFTLPENASAGISAGSEVPIIPLPLVGREDDLLGLKRLISQHRLVTVVGTAGIGKTSLALSAMQQYAADGLGHTAWVELARVADPSLVPFALAQALKAPPPEGADVLAAILAFLNGTDSLLVLDNAEHLVDAVTALAEAVLAAAPRAVLLVTSRSPLKLKHERVFRLGPLAVPSEAVPVETARTFGAVALFESRVQALDRRFGLDAGNVGLAIAICKRIDGIPLAIELAAARVPLLGLAAVADRLSERFPLLSGTARDVPERQRTLLAALDWSHELLAPGERRVLYRLGAFTGGFSLACAASVAREKAGDDWAGIDALAALVDRSLVEVDDSATPRYHLLESVREYAMLKLSAHPADLNAARRMHARAIFDHFSTGEAQWWTEPEAAWHSVYGPDLDNMRNALDWSVRHDRRMAVALIGVAHGLFVLEGLFRELRSWCERIDPPPRPAGALLARYWIARSEATMLVQREDALMFALKAMDIYRRLSERRGLYLAGSYAVRCAPHRMSRRILAEMSRLEQSTWPARVHFHGRRAQFHVATLESRDSEKERLLEDMLRLARASNAPSLVERTLSNMADHALAAGDIDRALALGQELLERVRERRNYQSFVVSLNLANAFLQSGNLPEARVHIERYLDFSRTLAWDGFGASVPVFALLAAAEGRSHGAARLLGYADRFMRTSRSQPGPNEARAYKLAFSHAQMALGPREFRRQMCMGANLEQAAVSALAIDTRDAARNS